MSAEAAVPPPGRATAGVVLAYRPARAIRDNLVALLGQVDRVFIVINAPDAATDRILEVFDDDPRVVKLPQVGNVGVAAGFNAGMRAALDDGFSYVWIFDQDSTVDGGMLDKLLGAYALPGRIGIVGPALRAAETGRVYDDDRGEGVKPRPVLISSGALFSRALLEDIGLHDEGLFIDYVDHDISLRAVAAGYTNVKVFDAVLDHRFGDSQPARFLGRRVYLSNYSPMRQYYMARNRVILLKRFGVAHWFGEDFRYLTKAWTKVLFCERGRPAKIRAAFRGIWDGLRTPARVRTRIP